MTDPSPPPDGERPPETSDFLRVPERVGKSIPVLAAVPLTREEVLRRRLRRGAWIAASVVMALALVYATYRVLRWRELEAATERAQATGRAEALDEVLSMVDGDTDGAAQARALRFHAWAALQGLDGHRERAAALALADLGEGVEARVGRTYVALAEGQPSRAAAEASQLQAASGSLAWEAGFARALAALAVGNIEAATEASSLAAGTPRGEALRLELAARGPGDVVLPEGDAPTVVRIARARVRWARGMGRPDAIADARAVLAAADATPAERAWAELLLGLDAVSKGETRQAAEALERAASHAPPGDEVFQMELADAWLTLGRLDRAQAPLGSLGTQVSADAGRRLLLEARRALVIGDVARAASLLESAPPSPRRDLLEGQRLSREGRSEASRAYFERAAQVADLEVEARASLSELLIRDGDARGALAAIEPLVERDATAPRVAAAVAYARGALGEQGAALAALEASLAVHTDEPIVLAARARVFLRAGQDREALDAYRRVAQVADSDVEVATERAIAARRVEGVEHDPALLEEARTSLDRALVLVPDHRRALLESLALANAAHDTPRALRALTGIDAAGHTGHDVDRLRAEALAQALAGQAGVDAVLAATRRHPEDGDLRYFLGILHEQAEDWNAAAEAYYSASTRETPLRRDALARRALAFGRARRAPSIEPAIVLLRVGTRETPLSPEHEALATLAGAWMEWHNEAFGRASIFARQAAEQAPRQTDVELLLGYIDALQRRDATLRMEAIAERSLEAIGWLVANVETTSCERVSAYLRGAPAGRFADAARRAEGRCR